MENRKLKRVKVETENGNRYIIFQPICGDKIDTCCISSCPYNGLCDSIEDPRDLTDPDSSFMDFCASVSVDGYAELSELANEPREPESDEPSSMACYVPQEGAIEKLFLELGRGDLIQSLLKTNPLIRLNTFVDSLCPGWCESYNKEHTNCNCGNSECILKTLLKK